LFGLWNRPEQWDRQGVISSFERRERQLGRRLDIGHYFYRFGERPPSWREEWHRDSGRIPKVAWGGDVSAAEIAAGLHDGHIRERAMATRAFGAPLFLRWFWEMDMAEHRERTGPPETYIAAWRRIHRIFHNNGADNALFVWCPTAQSFATGKASQWYPGDEYVDWVCADGYNWAPGRPNAEWRQFDEIYRAFYEFGLSVGKPMMVGEYGVQERNPGEKAAWFRTARRPRTALQRAGDQQLEPRAPPHACRIPPAFFDRPRTGPGENFTPFPPEYDLGWRGRHGVPAGDTDRRSVCGEDGRRQRRRQHRAGRRAG
jgi:hypothetical protein